ncbi:MAG: hypothetical protein KF773_27960 [Deltaproteobacteria bacterium]|nr:hypothetical protein [Deltaproteobacteria bacterium]
MSAASSSSYLRPEPHDRDDAASWMGLVYALAALVLVAALAGLSGCAPTLVAQSAAPPGRTARLDPIKGFWGNTLSYRLDISQGVALAMTCDQGGPCRRMVVQSDDPAIAEVKQASIGALTPTGFGPYAGTGHALDGSPAYGRAADGRATVAGLVVVGKQPGTTRVRVFVGDQTREIKIIVVPPPPQSPPATVAR